jgi:antitoxin component HigA of HigAB toxin-antitoxin module
MSTLRHFDTTDLPGRFADIVHLLPPQAIQDDIHYENMVEIIDQLMSMGKLTKGQAIYLETLVQLVQAYEAAHHAIDTSSVSGLDSLKHLLEENGMNASDLARLLDVHPSLGSKILRGERALTVEHLRKLCGQFKVNPRLFMD